ncbi:hypothetical protein EYF80_017367 [Liparis tanakae]|uniref:Uncharacterized protein n=1 Tax=Liparis tanakae TaxID=230148 RepID=A0A4Z2I3V5_9TELE|nr:hypothetical protein EYF80_017367 [Liparis tanakae]
MGQSGSAVQDMDWFALFVELQLFMDLKGQIVFIKNNRQGRLSSQTATPESVLGPAWWEGSPTNGLNPVNQRKTQFQTTTEKELQRSQALNKDSAKLKLNVRMYDWTSEEEKPRERKEMSQRVTTVVVKFTVWTL